ncbi:MAG: hypothetical protein QM784_11405 [Polyangiaceae bacterium]
MSSRFAGLLTGSQAVTNACSVAATSPSDGATREQDVISGMADETSSDKSAEWYNRMFPSKTRKWFHADAQK